MNQPIPVQYAKWATGMLTGDWGRSYRDSRPVRDVILDRVPATLELTVTALVFVFGGVGPEDRVRQHFAGMRWTAQG